MEEQKVKTVRKPDANELREVIGGVAETSHSIQLAGELLYRLQAQWWKAQAANTHLRSAERFYVEADQQLGEVVAEVNAALGVRIGETHRLDSQTWKIVRISPS